MDDKPNKTIQARPYRWPHSGSVDRNTTALVVVDMQRDCMKLNLASLCLNFVCYVGPSVFEEGGYLSKKGYDISLTRAIIPKIRHLLHTCRDKNFPIFHTREGHRDDLSDLSSRELFRSRNNPSGLGIGDKGPLGRLSRPQGRTPSPPRCIRGSARLGRPLSYETRATPRLMTGWVSGSRPRSGRRTEM